MENGPVGPNSITGFIYRRYLPGDIGILTRGDPDIFPSAVKENNCPVFQILRNIITYHHNRSVMVFQTAFVILYGPRGLRPLGP